MYGDRQYRNGPANASPKGVERLADDSDEINIAAASEPPTRVAIGPGNGSIDSTSPVQSTASVR